MWKKSISTLLMFLFTVSPFQPLWAMNSDTIDVNLLSGSESPRQRPAQSSPFRYSYNGDAYTDTGYFVKKEGYVKSIPYVAMAVVFEGAHRGAQLVTAIPRAALSLSGANQKVGYYLVGGAAFLSTYLANSILTFRNYTKASELDFGMGNATMSTELYSSQNTTSGASVQIDLDYSPTLSTPDWQNIPVPNFTMPTLPQVNASFLTNFTVSVPTLEIPQGVLAILPPALQDVLTQALNGQLASWTQATNDELRNGNDALQAATKELNAQLQMQESNLQKLNEEVQNLINSANAQGEIQALELRSALEDLGIATELSIDMPPITVSSDIEREFGFNNVSATGALEIGKWVTAIISDNIAKGIMTYIVGGGFVVVFGSACMAIIPWPKRIRPCEQACTALLQSLCGSSEQVSSNDDDQKIFQSAPDFLAVVYKAARGSQNEEEEVRLHSDSNFWQKVQMASEHPVVIGLENGMVYAGSHLLASFMVLEWLVNLKNFNASLPYATAANATNDTAYVVNQTYSNNFTVGKLDAKAYSNGSSDVRTKNAFSILLFATLAGLNDGDAQVFAVFGGMLIGTVVLFKLLAKVATWKNGMSASSGYSIP